MNDKSYRRNSTRRKRRLEVCCSFLPNLTFPLQYTIDYPRPRSKAGTSSSRTSRLMVPICCETNKLTKAGPFPWRCQPHTLPIPEPNTILSPCPDPPRVPAAPAPTRTRRCLARCPAPIPWRPHWGCRVPGSMRVPKIVVAQMHAAFRRDDSLVAVERHRMQGPAEIVRAARRTGNVL